MGINDPTLAGALPAARARRRSRAQKDRGRVSPPLPEFDGWDEALSTIARLVAMSGSPMAMMVGPRGMLYANDPVQRLFAKDAGSLNGRSVLDVMPAVAPFYAMVLKQALSGRSLNFEQQAVRLKTAAGHRTRWFNLDFTPIENEAGTVIGVLGAANDVTSLVRRVRSLSENEQRLRLALDGSGMVGIWTLDIASGACTADANVSAMFGVSPEAGAAGVALDRYLDAIHPDDRKDVDEKVAIAIASGQPYRSRHRLLDEQQKTHWVIASGKPIADENGEISRLLGVVVDVTDQMETASALAESRFRFQTLTETLPQIVWSCDAEGRHDYFSARWSEFTGIAPEDRGEDTWEGLVHPNDWERLQVAWQSALETGQAYDLDYRFLHHSGEYRWLRVMALPIRDETGRITRWFGTSTDVHDAYRLAEEREQLSRELERVATEDQLTGVLTRRAFFETAAARRTHAHRTSSPISLLMMDIDHFKSINDTYGHPVGDKVLAATARQIVAAVRENDFVGRLGGEEFSVFLPDCPPAEAMEIAERIRRSVQTSPIHLEDGRRIGVTISIGSTGALAADAHIDDLLSVADRALYQAKAEGRNCIRFVEA